MRWASTLVLVIIGCRVEPMKWTLLHGDHSDAAFPGGFVYDHRALPMAAERRWCPADALAPPVIPDAWRSVRGTRFNHGEGEPIGLLAGERMWWVAVDLSTAYPHTRPRRYLSIFALDHASGLRTETTIFEVDYEADLDLRWSVVGRDLVATYRGKRGRTMELRVRPGWFFPSDAIRWDATAPVPPPPPRPKIDAAE